MTKYKKMRQLQAGGQGTAWLCESDSGELAAAKFLLLTNDEERNADLKRRFAREVKSQMSLELPGVMPVLGMKLDVEAPYFLMAYARDGSLRERLPLEPDPPVPMSEDEAWQVFDSSRQPQVDYSR